MNWPCCLGSVPIPIVLALLFAAAFAFAQDDASLYYRRTHDGALPSANPHASDHSNETLDAYIAPKTITPKFAPALLDAGVNPTNLGKGDWIWQMPSCISALGVADVQGVIDYEKNRGMQWITVKCGDSGNIWSQFNTDLITRAHNAGLKIFGWAYVYGNNVQGEINVALNALNLGADGFIIDARIGIRNAREQQRGGLELLRRHPRLVPEPLPRARAVSHHQLPRRVSLRHVWQILRRRDAAGLLGGHRRDQLRRTMVTRMNNEWRNWQNSLGREHERHQTHRPHWPGLQLRQRPVTGTQISISSTRSRRIHHRPPPVDTKASASGVASIIPPTCGTPSARSRLARIRAPSHDAL